MIGKRIVINKKTCVTLLSAYVVGIYVWDYTIVYQAALAVMVACSILIYRNRWIRTTPYILTSALFLAYFAVHTLLGRSVNKAYSVDYLVTLFINLFAIIAIVCIVDSREKIETIMRVVIVTAVIIWIYALIADRARIFSGALSSGLKKPIFGGSYAHNNLPMLGGYAMLFLSYFRISKKPVKYSGLLYVFFSACILLSGARKTLIFAVFAIVLYPLMFSTKAERFSQKLLKFLLAFLSGLLIFYIILTNDILYDLIGYRFEGFVSGLTGGQFTESSANSRAVMIRTALACIKENFWLGIGLNTFRTLNGSFGTWSHNNYLEIMVSGGIAPLLIYYTAPVYQFVHLKKIKNDPMAGMFFTYLIFLVIFDLLSVSYNGRVVGLMLSLISAFLLIKKKEKRRAGEEQPAEPAAYGRKAY